MAHKKWRGYADFDMPEGIRAAIMTVCPGNPLQESQRFRATMQAASAKLDYLYIIEAGELGHHNLKRLVPKNEARPFAMFRGQRWQETHKPYIDEFMPDRCEIIPYSEIVKDTNHAERMQLIRAIYDRGHNPVTAWFDASIADDIASRSARKEREGVTIADWAIRDSALDYLCDEYAMRSIMWQRFSLPEIYVDLAVYEPDLFQKQNHDRPDIDLSIPPVRPVKLHDVEMVHVKRLGRSFPANDAPVPAHAGIQEKPGKLSHGMG